MADAALARTLRRNDRVASAVILCLLVAIALVVYRMGRRGAGDGEIALAPGVAAAGIEPAPALLGVFRLHGAPRAFDADTLYEYINGQAPQYVLFGFRALKVVEYVSAALPDAPIVVDLYDMEDRRNAFGIFHDTRPSEADPVEIGNDGYVSGNLAAFWKGGFFVRVQVLADDAMSDTAERAAREAAGWIPDTQGRLAEFAAFPSEGRLEGTMTFLKSAPFGLAHLRDAFVAEYEHEGRRYRLFFSEAGSRAAASEMLRRHVEFLASGAESQQIGPDGGRVWGRNRYLGGTFLVAQDGVVAGCIGLDDPAESERAVRGLLDRVKRLSAGHAEAGGP